MVRRGGFRALGATLAALLFAFIGVSAVSASSTCSVTVSPHTGVAGTVFSFHGKGFTPTLLTLQKDQEQASDHELTQQSDPWTLAVRSRPGDEGKWTAQFTGTSCIVSAQFTVTLTNTDVDAAEMPGFSRQAPTSGAAPSTDGRLPWGAVAIVIAAGAGGGLLASRGLRRHATDNRLP